MSFRKLKATKTNLISLTKKLKFIRKGENFLEYKQEQLIQQIKSTWTDYQQYKKDYIRSYINIMLILNDTYKEMGKRQVTVISQISKIQMTPSITIKYQKDFGILLPKINYKLIQEERMPSYSFDNTSLHLDQLIIELKQFFKNMMLFAEKEHILLRLAFSFKKISRRLNGLKNVITPGLISDIKLIKEILEELDRENFVRLKKTRDLINKRIYSD
ncbi:MAG: hypothetical protein EU533_04345 [Promethearchaeota archaeon]|nr:MAG: hypothetical protein EU533_04345 [Candidatus Lokiarchaeota archaeon]